MELVLIISYMLCVVASYYGALYLLKKTDLL
jgi:hypothetical protein